MLELLLECDLFERGKSCTNCKDGVLTVQNRKNEKIGKIYVCSNKDCNKIFMNILRDTFFYQKNISLHLYLTGCFIEKKKINCVQTESGHDIKTISKAFADYTIKCNAFMSGVNIRLGGEGRTVEMEETHLFYMYISSWKCACFGKNVGFRFN
jgi:hypothetical protein